MYIYTIRQLCVILHFIWKTKWKQNSVIWEPTEIQQKIHMADYRSVLLGRFNRHGMRSSRQTSAVATCIPVLFRCDQLVTTATISRVRAEASWTIYNTPINTVSNQIVRHCGLEEEISHPRTRSRPTSRTWSMWIKQKQEQLRTNWFKPDRIWSNLINSD